MQISLDDIMNQEGLSWEDFLKTPPEQRKKRWEEFKNFYPDDAGYWEDGDACNEDIVCQYFKDGWCSLQQLPALLIHT